MHLWFIHHENYGFLDYDNVFSHKTTKAKDFSTKEEAVIALDKLFVYSFESKQLNKQHLKHTRVISIEEAIMIELMTD